jgi:hypothetical protein
VGANLDIMRSDTIKQRTTPKGLKPFVMTNLKTLEGLDEVVAFIEKQACWRPDHLFQDEKSRLERRLFLNQCVITGWPDPDGTRELPG